MDELEVTAEALRKFFEATEKATEGMDGAAGALEKVGEKGEDATEALEKFTESFNEVTELLKGAAEAMDAFIESIGSSRVVSALVGLFSTSAEKHEGGGPEKPFYPLTGGVRGVYEHELYRESAMLADTEDREAKAGAKFADGPRGKLGSGSRLHRGNGPIEMDLVVFDIKKESAIEKQRAELRDERIAGEVKVASLQVRLAKTAEQREKAMTRFKRAEQQQQLNDLRKTAEHEQRVHERRQQMVAKLGETMVQTGDAWYEASKKAVHGQKGAVAEMLADFLKGVSKKHTILAVAEAAMGIGSLATFNFPGAAGHFASAAAHGAVAALAGGGAVAMTKIAEARKGGEEGGEAGKIPAGPGDASAAPSPSPSGGGGDEGQEAPVTQEQGRRGNPSARPSGGTTITINNPHIYAAGGIKEFAAKLRIELERQDRAGRKPRL